VCELFYSCNYILTVRFEGTNLVAVLLLWDSKNNQSSYNCRLKLHRQYKARLYLYS